MRKRIPILSTIALLAMTALIAESQTRESGISVISSVDRATCTIGDLVTYTVEVIHAESLRVQEVL